MATIHRITTDDSLLNDLRASLNERGVPAGRTFGQFVAAVMSLGITWDDPLGSIEYGQFNGPTHFGKGRLCAERDEDGEWEIREKV